MTKIVLVVSKRFKPGGMAPVSKSYGKIRPMRALCFSLSRNRLNLLPQARGEDRRAQRPPAGLRRADGHRAQEVQRGPGAGLRDRRVRGDVGGREPHL